MTNDNPSPPSTPPGSSPGTSCLPFLNRGILPIHSWLFLSLLQWPNLRICPQATLLVSVYLHPNISISWTYSDKFISRGRRDWWADQGGTALVSGTVKSSFTAYISHIHRPSVEGNGPMRDSMQGIQRGGWTACLSECVMGKYREVRGYLENQMSKFIIVMAFSGIHFAVACWQPVVSVYHLPPVSPSTANKHDWRRRVLA